jgi:hypothetical protein
VIEQSWQNVVGNLYQSIWGTHDERVATITEWMTEIADTPSYNIDTIVKRCCVKYEKGEF